MKRPAELRVVASLAILALAGFGMFAGSMNAGCTDGATPDCTGDASASCGLMPNTPDEGGTEAGDTVDGSTFDADMGTDTGSMDTDAQGDDGGGDDAGEAGD